MIKSVIKEVPSVEIKYPCLMIGKDDELVVLFSGVKCGMAVIADKNWPVGTFQHSWAMSEFKPFTGTVELSNE